jgi:hypothetical protein
MTLYTPILFIVAPDNIYSSVVDPNPDQIERQDPDLDPHESEKLDPDPHPDVRRSDKLDPDPHQSGDDMPKMYEI